MQRIERRERLHGPRQHREGARIALVCARLLPASGEPHFDLFDLAFGDAHHALDHVQALFLQDAAPRDKLALGERRQRPHARLLRSAREPVVKRPQA